MSVVKLFLEVNCTSVFIIKKYFLKTLPKVKGRCTRFHDGVSEIQCYGDVDSGFNKGIKSIPCVFINIGRFGGFVIDVIFHVVSTYVNVEEFHP